MGLNTWFQDDIRNALLAAHKASSSMASAAIDEPNLRIYLEGYRAALTTIALAFGLTSQAIMIRQPIAEISDAGEK